MPNDIVLRQILTVLQTQSTTSSGGGCSDTINVYAGKSAYLSAIENGYCGTELEWVTSLNGKTSYQHAIDGGFVGSVEECLLSLVGAKGEDSVVVGPKGEKGDSAFEIAQDAGFMGDEAAWLLTLVGAKGEKGEDSIEVEQTAEQQ